MTRTFDAPRRVVFDAWSKAEHVARWFTPKPLSTPKCEIDFRTGGTFYLVMRMPDGVEFPMNATYTEVTPPERISFSATIHGGIEVKTTVTFTEHDGKTTLDVHQTYSTDGDPVRGAVQGWTATLNQLAEVLAS